MNSFSNYNNPVIDFTINPDQHLLDHPLIGNLLFDEEEQNHPLKH